MNAGMNGASTMSSMMMWGGGAVYFTIIQGAYFIGRDIF